MPTSTEGTTNDQPLFFRLPEVARMLGLGRSTVYQLASEGRLPVVRIGRALRVPAGRLREWAEAIESEQLDG